jgi:hypothetical protein
MWPKQVLVDTIWFLLRAFVLVIPATGGFVVRTVYAIRGRRRGSASAGLPAVSTERRVDLPLAEPSGMKELDAQTIQPKPQGIANPPTRSLVRAAIAAVRSYTDEVIETRKLGHRMARHMRRFSDRQGLEGIDPKKQTVFLIITCGQAIRNFLLSDFYSLLASRYNLVILSPYAYSKKFAADYGRAGVHVLPWLTHYRSRFERVFLYYLMQTSGSGTHKGWLKNLAERARAGQSRRIVKNHAMSRVSSLVGSVLGRRGMLTLYQCYMVALLPKGMFKFLFERYRPALVISTAVHHSETWPLTYYAQRYGVKTLGKVLSWDNTTTKPALDPSCEVCAVWSEEMAREVERHFSYLKLETRVVGSPLFDMYYNRRLASDRPAFLSSLGLKPELPYVLYTTNTPAATTDEHVIVRQYWEALCRSPLAGKVSLLIRLHPKQKEEPYDQFKGFENVAVTLAGAPVWTQSDKWIPGESDMRLLLNSMLHASVSVNIASTMSLESFALNLPTINVAMRSSEDVESPTVLWSFDMFHTSDHYKALVENGAVTLAHNIDELVALTIDAVEHGTRRQTEMRRTLEQKSAHCDGTSAQRLFDVVGEMIKADPEFAAKRAAGVPGVAPIAGSAVAKPVAIN